MAFVLYEYAVVGSRARGCRYILSVILQGDSGPNAGCTTDEVEILHYMKIVEEARKIL